VNIIGQPFVELPTVESSNNYATSQVQAALAEHGAAWFAYHQTKGRGQRGKVWITEPGANIILTIVLEPKKLNIQQQFILSACVATACLDFFRLYAGDDSRIKWPNDIYWKDRKAGGMLIENILQGRVWKYCIAGIGMNINQTAFPAELKNPVSLKQITGKTFAAVDLAKELCNHLQNRWKQLEQGGYKTILSDYNSNLYKLNQPAIFSKNETELTGVVKGVSESGELLIEENDGKSSVLKFGEATWIL
jgi:BirA family biotin operon repressor/biotin-[acetyl-CoA-carboxylase] ligase